MKTSTFLNKLEQKVNKKKKKKERIHEFAIVLFPRKNVLAIEISILGLCLIMFLILLLYSLIFIPVVLHCPQLEPHMNGGCK